MNPKPQSTHSGRPVDAAENRRGESARERERIAAWMIQHGIATGHGNTVEELLATLAREVADLRAWKASALAVENEWDVQAMAKSLGDIKSLGRSCREVIQEAVKEIPALRQRAAMCDRLAEALESLVDSYSCDNCDVILKHGRGGKCRSCFSITEDARSALSEHRGIQPQSEPTSQNGIHQT